MIKIFSAIYFKLINNKKRLFTNNSYCQLYKRFTANAAHFVTENVYKSTFW